MIVDNWIIDILVWSFVLFIVLPTLIIFIPGKIDDWCLEYRSGILVEEDE